MARGKDAPEQVGGKISPYVQTSIRQSKELAENRLLTAMREAGATQRTAITERGASERAALQARTQRAGMAAQAASEDRRAAEAERARRDDMKFARTMQEMSQNFQARQAELDRAQQRAIIEGDRKAKNEIEKRREALRRFNVELNMDAAERNTNAMLSIIKGSLNKETSMEKAKTVLEEEATRFDKDKDIYLRTKERVADSVRFDKRMDLPVPKEKGVLRRAAPIVFKAAVGGMFDISAHRAGYEKLRKIEREFADPMSVLQDQVTKYGGSIAVEELSSDNIHRIETQIQEGRVKTEDINKTLGAIEGMLRTVSVKRKSAPKDSVDFDFWQDTYLDMSQMRDNLEGLAVSKRKVVGSETETVGSRVQYALGTVHNSSLGGRAARYRDLVGGNFDAVFEEMTKSIQVPKLYGVTEDMNEYDIEYRTWMNNYLKSRYPELGGIE